MTYIPIIEDNKHPLTLLRLKFDGPAMGGLCDQVSEGRPARFSRIVVSGGVMTKSGWRGQLQHIDINDKLTAKNSRARGLVLGYFHPRRGEIRLFPEAVWLVACRGLLANDYIWPDEQEILIDQFHGDFYQTLIEELEHGYQQPHLREYRSLTGRLVTFTSPALIYLVIASVGYIVLFEKPYWWLVLVFVTMMTWIFLPVWVSMIPTPAWWQRLRYHTNQRENDAKGKAVSVRLSRLALRAIWFEPKRSRMNSLF